MKHKILFILALVVLTNATFARGVTDRYDETFRKYSKRFFSVAFDWRVFKAQGMAESNLEMNAKSWVGAKGIMQLMPMTFREIQSKNPEIKAINHPEWNIAAGIYYNRQLWTQWEEDVDRTDHHRFMFSSYNAGRGTLLRAQKVALAKALDPMFWLSIRTVAPDVPNWRHQETLGYIERIETNLARMDDDGHIVK